MFTKPEKIYKYFYQNIAEIDKKLADLSAFNFATFLNSDDNLLFVNRLQLLSDNFLKKVLNEYLWLDKQLFNFLDLDLINQFLSSPDKDKINLLSDNIKIISSAIGEEDNLDRYNVDEIISCINLSKKDFDFFSIINSLRQELFDQHNRDLIKAIFNYLQKVELYRDWEIKELVVFVLLLNIIWKNFDFLLPVEQSYLLNLFFYISVLIGIPVASILKNSIYQTSNPVDFVVKNKFLADALDKNIEIIPVDKNIQQVADLGEVFKIFLALNQEPSGFVRNSYQADQKVLSDSLVEVLIVYYGLKNANLIDKNYVGEDNEADNYNQEVSDLLSWFIAKSDWNKLLDYYKNKTPRVPFEVLINNFPLFIDLKKPEAVEKISEFTNLLKLNNIISSDKEIIEFHESDGQFHWASWLAK